MKKQHFIEYILRDFTADKMKIPEAQLYSPQISDSAHPNMSPSAQLAMKFRQKWMALHPQDTCNSGGNLDDSLTSLGWLQNLKVSEFTQSNSTPSPSNGLNSNINFIKQDLQGLTSNITSPQTAMLESRLQVGDTAPSYGASRNLFDYKSNPYVKPPYSYTSLICMAMQSTKKSKITLSCIYSWIKENFMYYRLSDPSWQNSIRHNLSLNKCFEKVARQKDEPGKGGFWRINPEYGCLMENGVFKKRQSSWDSVLSPPLKRSKLNDNTSRVSGLKSGSRDDKFLSNSYKDMGLNEDDDDDNSLNLKESLSWNTVFDQDMKIGRRLNKTGDAQNNSDNSPFMDMSPPSSETNSSDLGLELFTHTDFPIGFPLEFHSNDPLDLTVQGTTIRPPDWWSADGTSNFIILNNSCNNKSNLQASAASSQETLHGDSIWGESMGLSSNSNNFDFDSLFEFDNLANQN